MIRRKVVLTCAAIVAALVCASASHAGLGDALKKKLEEKAKQKAEQAVDKAADKAEQGATGKPKDAAATSPAPAAESKEMPTASGGAPGASVKVAEVPSKFDYVPGDKVIIDDDYTQDEIGEFPAKLKPVMGNFEVVESAGERWVRCLSPDGTVRLRLPEGAPLPEYWTLEFDFFATEPMGSALTVRGMAKDDYTVWEAVFPHQESMAFRSGDFYSTTPLEGSEVPGRHHVMFMARGRGLKAYIDRERLASTPEVTSQHGPAMALDIRLWAGTKPMITNLRFAEGCKPAKDMLATGKLVTYGIRFATGSDVVLPESAPVLRQVAAWLQANPAAKLTITGHTDNVGSPAANLDLSKRRAASVAKVLVDQFSIVAERLATQGKGDTQALADNSKPEGRAMNRRVEFTKL